MVNNKETRSMSFLFAKMHFIGLFHVDAFRRIPEFFETAQQRPIIEDRYQWVIGDTGSQELRSDVVHFGRLGKVVHSKKELIYDQHNHTFKHENIRSREATYANFVIVPKHCLLCFEERWNLGRTQFLKKFAEFWKTVDKQYAELEFDLIKSEVEIWEAVRSWGRVTRATFTLRPTNPSASREFEEMDAVIRRAKATRARVEFCNDSDEGSLNTDDSLVSQGLSMATAGYGDATLEGQKEDAVTSVSTKEHLVKRIVESNDKPEALAARLYEEADDVNKRGGTAA